LHNISWRYFELLRTPLHSFVFALSFSPILSSFSPSFPLIREWVDATPAFGAAMSSDDLTRQIHWLHKHNAAKHAASPKPSVSPPLSAFDPSVISTSLSPSSLQPSFDEENGEGDGGRDNANAGPSWLVKASQVLQKHAHRLSLTTPSGAV